MSLIRWARPSAFLLAAAVFAVVLTACGTAEQPRDPERDLFVPSTDSEDGLSIVITDLVCQIDRPTFTVITVGRIENRTDATLTDVTPNVRWLDDAGNTVSTVIGDSVDEIEIGESNLFSISTFLSEDMEACRVDVGGRGSTPLTGELQADAVMTSELAR